MLAAVVLVAVAGLLKLSTLKQLWRGDRAEFVVAIVAILGVLTSGLLRGVMIGAVISLVQLLRAASRPHVAFLGRIPGTRRFSDRERNPDNELIDGVLIFRPESGLVYFNVDHVCESILKRVHAEPTPPTLVVLDCSRRPVPSSRTAFLGARPFAQRGRGSETRRSKPFHFGGRRGRRFSENGGLLTND